MSTVDTKLKEFLDTTNKKDQLQKLQELLEESEFRDELDNVGLLGYITATYMNLLLQPLRETLNKKVSWRQLDDETSRNVMSHLRAGDWIGTNDIYKKYTEGSGEYKDTVDDIINILKKVSIYPGISNWSEYLSSKLKSAYTNADWTKLADIEASNSGHNKEYFTSGDNTEEIFKEKLNNWTEKINTLFTQLFTDLGNWENENNFFILDPRFVYIALLQNTYFWNEYVVARNDPMIIAAFQEVSQDLMNSITNSFETSNQTPEELYNSLYKKYKEQFTQKEEEQKANPTEEEDVTKSDT